MRKTPSHPTGHSLFIFPFACMLALLTCLGICSTALAQDTAATPPPTAVQVKLDPRSPDAGIQAAIDALGPAGGQVVLPAGKIVLKRSVMLRDNITLQGQGQGKTILTTDVMDTWIPIAKAIDNTTFELPAIPEGLKVGTSVYVWPDRPIRGWLGYYTPGIVTAIQGNAITLDQPWPRKNKPAWISFGLCSVLTQPCNQGDDKLHVADASIFTVGGAIAVGSADGNGNESLTFIKAIEGNTLVLERPIRMTHDGKTDKFWKRPAVWMLFPLVTAENARNVTLQGMTLQSPIPPQDRPKLRRYTLSPVHLWNCQDSLVQDIHIDNSFTDGLSVQGGSKVVIRHTLVTHSQGNGFHPGTGLQNAIFEDNIARDNGAGLYFCWHNRGHVIRKNQFIHNGAGITGLGNPGDINNLIEDNLIAQNRAQGLVINGGKASGNVIRNNIFRDNSLANPGKHPAIELHARSEDARQYTIEGNTFENTLDSRPQKAGVIEQASKRGKTMNVVDENIIRHNHYVNMRDADVVRLGPHTVVEETNANVVIQTPKTPEAPPEASAAKP